MANAARTYRPSQTRRHRTPESRPSASLRGYGGKAWRGKYTLRGMGGVRGQVFAAAQGRCAQCGGLVSQTGRGPQGAAIHHIVPKSMGGGDEISNLQLLHNRCHNILTATGGRIPDAAPKRLADAG
jgi:5-methylcytosine-specific restriction endonuclease McrA